MAPPKRQLSLRGLRTFCAAAATLNFRQAADNLYVTPSAVSHQIKRLEGEVGVELFDRDGRQLSLTTAGQTLYDEIAPLLTRIDQAAKRFQARHQRTPLRVSVQPFFASELFVPRLAEFTEQHPEFDIHVDTSDETLAHHPKDADLSIRLFKEAPQSLTSRALFPLRLVAACSPQVHTQLAANGGRIDPRLSLIVHNTRADAWQRWHDQQGLSMAPEQRIVRLDSMITVLRAAERGLGLALVPLPLACDWFETGAVVRFGDDELLTDDYYHLVYDRKSENIDAIRVLRDWVLSTFSAIR